MSLTYEGAPDNLNATLAEICDREERDRLLDKVTETWINGPEWAHERACEEFYEAFPDEEIEQSDLRLRAMAMERER